jgi:octaprenyl-diphosphate synthase
VIKQTSSDYREGVDLAEVIPPNRNHEVAFLEHLEAFLEEQVTSFEPEVREHIVSCLRVGGKRIRPTLLGRAAFAGEVQVSRDQVKAAAVVELVHLATLVHDDVLDEATLRRSNTTLFSEQGASVAVLVGDALFAHALKLAAEFPTNEVCAWVSEATRRTCAGEIRQSFNRGKLNLSLDEYYRVIELKTAELFRVSCLVGAFLGGFEDGFRGAAATFGLRLGIAYQLFDDLADIFGDELRFGKTLGTDWLNRKPTLPLILLLSDMDPDAAQHLWESTEAGVDEIRQMLIARSLFESCIFQARKELAAAETSLSAFSSLPPVPLLLDGVRYMEKKLLELRI